MSLNCLRTSAFSFPLNEKCVSLWCSISVSYTHLDVYKRQKNALVCDMALGCSTNTMLHLPAIAHEAGLRFQLDRVNEISDSVPHIVKLNPAGQHFLVDLNNAGGLSAVMKRLDGMGLICADALTVDGEWSDRINAARIADDNVIRTRETAYSPTGGLAVLYGNLAPDGAVVKKGAVLPEMLVHTCLLYTSRKKPISTNTGAFSPYSNSEGSMLTVPS